MTATRILGMAIEVYVNLCFSIGGNTVTTGDFPDIVSARLDNLGERDLLLFLEQKNFAIQYGSKIRECLFINH